MLDINKIRDDQEGIRKALLKRLEADQLDQILKKVLKLDKNRRKLKAERNQQSKTKPTSEIIERLKTSGEDIRILDGKLAKIEIKFFEIMSELPNIPADDVVSGGKENNQVVKTFGEKPKFNFTPKDHYGLATSLDIIDYERGVKMSGANFWIYKGQGALLEWALLNYFIDFHTKNGYQFMIPPFLLTEKSAYTSGHLPKFKDDLFWTLALMPPRK